MHTIKDQQVQNYLPIAMDVVLHKPNQHIGQLSLKQRVLVTKIIQNINYICKLNKKQVVEILKASPSYQPVLAELYFQQMINDWKLITNDPDPAMSAIAVNKICQSQECVGVEYRIQFTLSSISQKKGVKVIILLIFFLQNGAQFKVYFSLAEFSNFRYQIANAIKSIYSIEMKSLF